MNTELRFLVTWVVQSFSHALAAKVLLEFELIAKMTNEEKQVVFITCTQFADLNADDKILCIE